jgi:hypothetical protein
LVILRATSRWAETEARPPLPEEAQRVAERRVALDLLDRKGLADDPLAT